MASGAGIYTRLTMTFITPSDLRPPPDDLRPVDGNLFALIDQVPVLFSEDEQKLFELNDVAAFIWCGLKDMVPLGTISQQLIDRGLSPASARKSLSDALHQWLSNGLILPHSTKANLAFAACIGRTPIEIQASDDQIGDFLRSLFVTVTAPTGGTTTAFKAYRIGASSIVTRDDRRIFKCAMDQLAPTFKAYLVEQLLLAADPHDLIFHAAAVTSGGNTMLISAPPGAGKSTLTIHLLHAGFQYLTDDTVIIRRDGSIYTAPFAPTLKSGAWAIIDRLRPDVKSLPSHNRPDGLVVRYLNVASSLPEAAITVNRIVFLERVADCKPALTELDQLDTLKRIIDASFSTHGKLTADGFVALKRIISQARSFVLRYSEAEAATAELAGLRDGKF
ncbi:PqqD family peptide modification chaperone [Rhodopseudomonas sp. B29]|uniref:PqqD family peptide modification chaperone n=1 Tax=Rhodopseudomonas sp. B29 TaxID=95607 RepID=UPI0003B69CD9|nr:PqqD family peptide modification chaperone [Rhodopseudomonas sp. B29]